MRPPVSARPSLVDAAQWGFAWLGREWRLAAPVALAFLALPGVAAQLLAPAMQEAATDPARMGAAMLWLLPVLLVGLYGGLAITALALMPGGSVGEALARAARRYPVLLGAVALVSIGLVLVLSLFSIVGTAAGLPLGALVRAGQQLVTLGGLLLAARLLPLLPVVAAEHGGPAAVLRRSWALGRGAWLRLLGLVLAMALLGLVLTFLAQAAVGTVVGVLTLTTSGGDLAAALGALVLGLVGAAISSCCYVVVAGVYRRLAR